MRAAPLLVIALVAGCNQGPSCAEQKRAASSTFRTARIAASDIENEQRAFDEATKRLEQLVAFQIALIEGVSADCRPKLVCCEKAARWIATEARAPAGERPTWRLPRFRAESKLVSPDLAKHIVTYDDAADRLASLLQKGGDAPLADVTAACTDANTELELVRNALVSAVSAAHADATSTGDTLAIANGRVALFQQWEDAITNNTKFEVPPPSPTEPTKISEARAAATSIQGCLK